MRTLRVLREEDVPAASLRDSIMAMKAVAGMENPLLEARVVRTGTRLAFRHGGEMVDPIRRQLLFDFERVENGERRSAAAELSPMRPPAHGLNEKFMAAVQAEEAGEKQRAIALYEQILAVDPRYAAASINLGTVYFHLRQYTRAEEFYRRATEIDPNYVLAYFDLGNVLDELERINESIAAYQRAVALSPRYADAHYNLALAYERRRRKCATRCVPLAGIYQARQPRAVGRPCPRPDSQTAGSREAAGCLPGHKVHATAQGNGCTGTGVGKDRAQGLGARD